MLKHRIITTLLFDDTLQCVKPVAFGRPYRRLGPLTQYIKVVERRNVDELILLDICATQNGRAPFFKELSVLCSNIYAPVCYGGSIRSLDDIKMALDHGADKVAIKTKLEDLEFIARAAEKFGSQCIVAAVDIKDNRVDSIPNILPIERIFEILVQYGVGEILLTDTKQDGTLNGYNLDIIRVCSNAVGIPIIANGGAGAPSHMVEAIRAGANAVAAGSMFLYTEFTPKMCAEELHKNNIPVRLHG